jgi:hypothetical protein
MKFCQKLSVECKQKFFIVTFTQNTCFEEIKAEKGMFFILKILK